MPGLWRLEIANAFQTAVRRQRIDADYRDISLAELGTLSITNDADTNAYAWSTLCGSPSGFRLRFMTPPIANSRSGAAYRSPLSIGTCAGQRRR